MRTQLAWELLGRKKMFGAETLRVWVPNGKDLMFPDGTIERGYELRMVTNLERSKCYGFGSVGRRHYEWLAWRSGEISFWFWLRLRLDV